MKKKSKSNRKKLLNTDNFDLAHSDSQPIDFRSLTLRQMESLEYLNGSNMPSTFRFRETETERIRTFLDSCMKRQHKGYRFIMLTGSPGAGKTLCINSVLKDIQCDVIRMNANLVKSIEGVQEIISMKLLGDTKTRTAPQIMRELEAMDYEKTCLVYVEEIELLFKSSPNPISLDFLTLFNRRKINFILLGISNTIDTIQKYSSKYSFNVKEIENIVFSPYKAEHIMAILGDKLMHIEGKMRIKVDFVEKLMKFSAQKLETLKKGDFRICIQFLKEIVKECYQSVDSRQEQEFQTQMPHYKISIKMINTVFEHMQISKNSLISSLSGQHQIILAALHNITLHTDAIRIPLRQLQKELKWIHSSLLIKQVDMTPQQISQRLKELQQYAMIELRKKNTFELQIVVKVSNNEIMVSLEDNQLLVKIMDRQAKK